MRAYFGPPGGYPRGFKLQMDARRVRGLNPVNLWPDEVAEYVQIQLKIRKALGVRQSPAGSDDGCLRRRKICEYLSGVLGSTLTLTMMQLLTSDFGPCLP